MISNKLDDTMMQYFWRREIYIAYLINRHTKHYSFIKAVI